MNKVSSFHTQVGLQSSGEATAAFDSPQALSISQPYLTALLVLRPPELTLCRLQRLSLGLWLRSSPKPRPNGSHVPWGPPLFPRHCGAAPYLCPGHTHHRRHTHRPNPSHPLPPVPPAQGVTRPLRGGQPPFPAANQRSSLRGPPCSSQ